MCPGVISAYKGHIFRRSRSRHFLAPLSFRSPTLSFLSFFSPVSTVADVETKTWNTNKNPQSACVRVLSFPALRTFYQRRRLDPVAHPPTSAGNFQAYTFASIALTPFWIFLTFFSIPSFIRRGFFLSFFLISKNPQPSNAHSLTRISSRLIN